MSRQDALQATTHHNFDCHANMLCCVGQTHCRLNDTVSRLEGRERELSEELVRTRQALHSARMELVGGLGGWVAGSGR